MEYTMNNFAELNNEEAEYILGGGVGTGLVGAVGGACTGFLAGGKAGVLFGPTGFAVCVVGGTVGGAIAGFVAGY